MSTVDFIQRSLEFTHSALIDARNGTDEQLHFVPSAAATRSRGVSGTPRASRT